ncbi:hypothetical protein JWR97_13045 [Pseudomonas cedrina subsp. fulgida]|nr:hypothetical protein [Pseudomonas cedrina subsp. fulgida]
MAIYEITSVVVDPNGPKTITGKAPPHTRVTLWEERFEGVVAKWVIIGTVVADANGDFSRWTPDTDKNAKSFYATDGDEPKV